MNGEEKKLLEESASSEGPSSPSSWLKKKSEELISEFSR